MNRTSVFKWCREFKNGRTSVHDDQRSGRPSILTYNIVEKIENALRDDRRLTVDELSAMFPQISRSLLHETITETLGYRKLSARWAPKQLTDQHKLNRMEAGQDREPPSDSDPNFLDKIITGDESWCFQYDPSTKRQSMEWRGRGEGRPTKIIHNVNMEELSSIVKNKQNFNNYELWMNEQLSKQLVNGEVDIISETTLKCDSDAVDESQLPDCEMYDNNDDSDNQDQEYNPSKKARVITADVSPHKFEKAWRDWTKQKDSTKSTDYNWKNFLGKGNE
ncbi:SETMR methyltransferase, partial [Pseudoatta argentina]